MRVFSRGATRGIVAGLAVAAVAVALAACVPEPSPSSSSSPEPTRTTSPTPTPSDTSSPSPTPTASPSPSPTPVGNITLPGACEGIYSPGMIDALQASGPPLNNPEITMYSTQVVEALEVLSSGVPTLRCTWGAPSESGSATNVTIVDAGQAETVRNALVNAGFSCSEAHGGTLCSIDEEFLSQDDVVVHRTESHFLRGNGWISTTMLNFAMDGYTDDIVATLWG